MKTIQKVFFVIGILMLAANSYAGRWLSRDPIEFMERDPKPSDANFQEQLNLYRFVRNNPLRYIDPDGKAPQVVGVSYDLNTGSSDVQYEYQQFGQGYGIGAHNPLDIPKGGFLFSGFAKNLPKNQGKIEGIGFLGYNRHEGVLCGGINAFATNHRLLNGGFGPEGMWSSQNGWSLQNVAITDFDFGVGGLGEITGQNGDSSLFFYVQLPLKYGDAFWGVGIDR